MKLKIVLVFAVIIFAISVFPANVFAHDEGHAEEENSNNENAVILTVVVVGFVVWAVWPKNRDNADANFEEVEDNLSVTESTSNWRLDVSYNYKEDSYSLGAIYGF